jgi:hypothetical protein
MTQKKYKKQDKMMTRFEVRLSLKENEKLIKLIKKLNMTRREFVIKVAKYYGEIRQL